MLSILLHRRNWSCRHKVDQENGEKEEASENHISFWCLMWGGLRGGREVGDFSVQFPCAQEKK